MDTKIDRTTPYSRENIDSINWITSPPTSLSVPSSGGLLFVQCVDILDDESHSFTDELRLYRTNFVKGHRNHQHEPLESVGCGVIHRDMNNYVEEAGRLMNVGRRSKLSYGYFRYEVSIRVENSIKDDQGMYVCSLERKHDRLYTSSWVGHGDINMHPIVWIISCEAQSTRRTPFTLHLTRGRTTCLRCRGVGYPIPKLIMHKNRKVLRENKHLSFDSHLNVADGGIAEITYTFWDPSPRDEGDYTCYAYDENKNTNEATAHFKIRVKY